MAGPTSRPPQASDGVLLELLDELTRAGHFAETTVETITSTSARFGVFCRNFGVDPMPASDLTVLAFLQSQQPGLAWAHAKTQVSSIVGAHELAGLSRPDLPQTGMFLQALLRDPASPTPQPKVAALTEAEVETMVSGLAASWTLDDRRDPEVAGRRAAAALARLGGDTWAEICSTPFTPRGHEDGPDESTEDSSHRLAREALAAAAHHGERISAFLNPDGIDRRMRGLGRRAGFTVARPADVRALNDADFRTLLAYCDPAHERNVRDCAYVCMGVSGALRHISLAHVGLEDLQCTDDGFVATIRRAKLPAGQVLVKEFRHLADVPGSCSDPLCPACAIERQLDVCRRRGRVTGPLLATLYGGELRPMTRQNGRLRVLQSYAELDPATRRRIATRSLRSTAATWAFKEGMSIAEIAEYVTNHRDESTCRLYVRVGAGRPPLRPQLS